MPIRDGTDGGSERVVPVGESTSGEEEDGEPKENRRGAAGDENACRDAVRRASRLGFCPFQWNRIGRIVPPFDHDDLPEAHRRAGESEAVVRRSFALAGISSAFRGNQR